MLTSLEIENFKGIAARQRVDFAPLTLLFGANSAGKSTVLQALLYLQELVERGSADVDRTELGGDVVDLGGFARLVHGHDIKRSIVLRAEFETPSGLERFGRDLSGFPFPDLDDDIESAWVELSVNVRTTPAYRGPIVDQAVIGVNGHAQPLVWLEIGTTLREGEPLHARVNLEHPLLAVEAHPSLRERVAAEAEGVWLPEGSAHAPDAVVESWGRISISLSEDSSKLRHDPQYPVFAIARGRLSALPSPGEPLRVIPFEDDAPEDLATAREVRTFLEMVVLGTTAQLATFLRDARYIGPLRTIPPRGFLYERAGRITSWADGLAAWDLLLADRHSLVERTNVWLRRLGTGCQVVVQHLFEGGAKAEEISAGHVDKTARRLLLDTGAGSLVLPSEVGAGISQIIPVIVAALEGRLGLTLVEQPEIHVHPAVQVGLGDLLIEAVTREVSRRMLLVETHSEHLILRLLRRIRETTENELEDGRLAFSDDKLSVLNVESTAQGVRVQRLRVDDHGEFLDRWPRGFFAERMEELL